MKVYSRGPVFYKRARLGLHGKGFDLIKFRTMNEGSDQKKSGLRTQVFDNRITNIGRALRKSYIDELPQFWNVFKGDMSIVGPRPLAVHHYERDLQQGNVTRSLIKGGLIGLGHVQKGTPEMGEPIYEYEYIDQCLKRTSLGLLWLDLIIIWRGFKVILQGKGL